MIQDIFILVGILLAAFAPFAAIGWIIYRLIKGSSSKNNNSIIGD